MVGITARVCFSLRKSKQNLKVPIQKANKTAL